MHDPPFISRFTVYRGTIGVGGVVVTGGAADVVGADVDGGAVLEGGAHTVVTDTVLRTPLTVAVAV